MSYQNSSQLEKAIAIPLLIFLSIFFLVREKTQLSKREFVSETLAATLFVEANPSLIQRNHELHQERIQNWRQNQRNQNQRYRDIRRRQEERIQRHNELKQKQRERIQPPEEASEHRANEIFRGFNYLVG